MADTAVDALVATALDGARSLRRCGGRTLSYLDLGADGGRPLLHFHGTGFSALEALTGAKLAVEAGVRLIAFDRPGFGGSTANPGRDLADVARDAVALVDHLGLDRFDVSSFSGGVPHALAFAAMVGSRCGQVFGINTAGDVTSPAWRKVPIAARVLVRVMTTRPIARRMWPRMFADIPAMLAPDTSTQSAALLDAAFHRGSGHGHEASLHELELFYRKGWHDPWQTLATPVTLLHGREDGLLPFARALTARHSRTTLVEIPGKHMDWATAAVWRPLLAKVS